MTADPLPVAHPWFDVAEVAPGVYRVTEYFCHPLVRANCFFVKGSARDMLVDSGMGIGRLRAALAPLIDKPVVLVTTHAHVNHMGGHHEFADAEILVHSLEAGALAAPPGPPGLGFEGFSAADTAAFAAMGFVTTGLLVDAIPAPGYEPDAYRCHGVTATGFLQEGDVVDLGRQALCVLHLPGHSPGGIGLFDAADATLFAGDTLYDGPLFDAIEGADGGRIAPRSALGLSSRAHRPRRAPAIVRA